MSKRLTTAEWVERASVKHGDRYDYSETVYLGAGKKLRIICRLHGAFETHPATHIKVGGCPQCAGKGSNQDGSLTTEEFIARAKAVHGNRYDYSRSVYAGSKVNLTIGCEKHGIFEQAAANHLSGSGCLVCAKEIRAHKRKIKTSDLMAQVVKAHGLKYIYFLDSYTTEEDFRFMCPTHGIIRQRLCYHIRPSGCVKCHEMRLAQKRPAELTVDLLNEYLYVDLDTGVITHKIPYKRKASGDPVRLTYNPAGYAIFSLLGHTISVHRAVWAVAHNRMVADNMTIDHINGDVTCNRLSNLREVPQGLNSKNHKRNKRNTTGVCGVSYLEHAGVYTAHIFHNYKSIYIGRYRTLEEAAAARKEAEKKYGYHEFHGMPAEEKAKQ